MTSDEAAEFEPFVVDVNVGGSGIARERAGPYSMRLTDERLTLSPKSKGGLGFNRLPVSIEYGSLSELSNHVRDKGYFKANFGTTKNQWGRSDELVMGIGIVDRDQFERVASVLDKLPPEVSAKRCPKCKGAVLEDVCGACGAHFSEHYRKRGIGKIFGGVTLAVVAVFALSLISPDSSTIFFFFLLLAGLGIFQTLRGLYQLVLGTRVGKL